MANIFDQFDAPTPPANPFNQFDTPTPPQLDPYQQAAVDKFAKLKAAGVNPDYGLSEQFANGALLGALPTIMAGLQTPAAMIEHRTFSPVQGYDYAKAEENLANSEGSAAHPYLAAVANLAGGMMTGATLPRAGLTAVREGAGLLGRVAGSAIDGSALGAASGFLSNEGDNRLSGAGEGALAGGILGGGVPAALGVAGAVARPVTAGVAARLMPENSAKASLARALQAAGRTPQELQAALDNATAAGQSNFTLADALGKPGADMLSNVVRSPGEAGTQAADFLDARQAAQGRDVANQLSTGLGVTRTAQQLTGDLTAQRGADAAVNYGAARNTPGAAAVDVSPAIAAADNILTPGVTRLVNPNSGIADNSVEAVVRRARGYLTDGNSQLSNFPDVLSAKQEIDN